MNTSLKTIREWLKEELWKKAITVAKNVVFQLTDHMNLKSLSNQVAILIQLNVHLNSVSSACLVIVCQK